LSRRPRLRPVCLHLMRMGAFPSLRTLTTPLAVRLDSSTRLIHCEPAASLAAPTASGRGEAAGTSLEASPSFSAFGKTHRLIAGSQRPVVWERRQDPICWQGSTLAGRRPRTRQKRSPINRSTKTGPPDNRLEGDRRDDRVRVAAGRHVPPAATRP
jgi:hypothetical protein